MHLVRRVPFVSVMFVGMVLVGAGCGGGAASSTYTVGGTVAGLAAGGTLVLQNNGGDDLTITEDGPFTFATILEDGAAYEVTVAEQPAGQTCTVTNGAGTISGANVTDVAVACADETYTVGGTVAGLAAGGTLVLQNNGGDDLTITEDGPFTFATTLEDGAAYEVTVAEQPAGQTCTVTNGTGTISGADVTDVAVACADETYTVGGTVSGLDAGEKLVLQNNGGDDLTITEDGPFTFATTLEDGAAYEVTVAGQPAGQTCTVTNGAGTIAGANVTDVAVECVGSGELDASFGDGGVASHDFGFGGDAGLAIATDANDRILVSGLAMNATDGDAVVLRYNPDGTPDASFGSGGFVIFDNEGRFDRGDALAIDSDGGIVVAGFSNVSPQEDVLVLKYKPDSGQLDDSFGSNGVIVYDSGQRERGAAVAIDASGRILVTGRVRQGSSYDILLLAFNSDGTLDTGFGTDGVVTYDGGGNDVGNAVTTDSRGRIFVGGTSENGIDHDAIVIAYEPDGTPDTNFGVGGVVTFDGGKGDDFGEALAIDSSGRILVAGMATTESGDYQMLLLAYDADGNQDAGFGTGGVVTYDVGSENDEALAIAIDSLGRILLTGLVTARSRIMVLRFNPDGTLDTHFGTDGIATCYSGSNASGSAITTDAWGRILVAGFANTDIQVLRLVP